MTEQALLTLRTLLPQSGTITRTEVEEAVDNILLLPNYKLLDREIIIRRIEELYRIRQDEYRIIEKDERKRPWLNEKRTSIGFERGFWGRYRTYLQFEKNFPPDTISKLDRLTDKILDSLFDPTESIQIDKKGLVVGQVQSGKTANYTGLICKAADAGFKLIIILAGIHNNLRSQTQLRLDEGFLGFDTQHARAFNQSNLHIGVGKLGEPIVAHSLTSSLEKGDFTKGAADALGLNFHTNEPILAVIKKNPSVLRRLYQWLGAQAEEGEKGKIIRNKPLLLIDDEADNASINISNDPGKRSTINKWITDILKLFGKNGYVGYTATPFANIFIPLEEDNLFPRDFIINIPAPSNYIGPERVFGFELLEEDDELENVLPVVNRIDDYSYFVPDKHKKDDTLPTGLPESLKKAIRSFIITCAIRRLRGQVNAHNSMLIHVSRFVRWQNHINELVSDQFQEYRRGIDLNDEFTLNKFKDDFEKDSNGYKSFTTVSGAIQNSPLNSLDSRIEVHNWTDVLRHLNEAASRIHVKAIYGGSGEALEYYEHKNGLSVIAVGGNKLSRGLTLEGLSVSYYLRASKMYDTLMQMGRWFGYRPGYVDLCRLFTSRELNEWFCHITQASEELREEFDYMSDVAGSTPEEYALKVRTHPGVLQISATNKLRSAVTIQISWSGKLVESYEFEKKVEIMRNNLECTRNFIKTIDSQIKHEEKASCYLWRNVNPREIIGFFEEFKGVENLKRAEPGKLIQYIQSQLRNDELTNWSVALMSKSGGKTTVFSFNEDKKYIGQWIRKEDENNSSRDIYFVRKSHIISPKDEFVDLTDDDFKLALDLTNRYLRSKDEKEKTQPIGRIIREEVRSPQNPLLLIYLLDTKESLTKFQMEDSSVPFVGYAISFPRSNYNIPVSYAVNEELLDRFDFVEEEPEDYGEDED